MLCLVVLLLTAGWHHITRSPDFRSLLAAQNIWPPRYIAFLSVVVPLTEIVIAALLIVESMHLTDSPVGSVPAAILFISYSIYLLVLLRYRPSAPCACSSTEEEVTVVHVARAAALALVSLFCIRIDGAVLQGLESSQSGIAIAAGFAGASIAWILPSAVANPWSVSR